MSLPQKHVGFARSRIPSNIRNSIFCPHSRFVHSHHSLLFLLYTNVGLRRFWRHADSPFRCARCPRPYARASIDARLPREAQNVPPSNLELLPVPRSKKSPSLAITTALFCRSSTPPLHTRGKCLRSGIRALRQFSQCV
jgi:hypothetical protein